MVNGSKKIKHALIAFILPIGISMAILIGTRHAYFNSNKDGYNDLINIESGDIIFRQGKGIWSPYFSKINTITGFSHIGVLINLDDAFYVLHAEANDLTLKGGIKKTALNSFIDESLKFEIKKNIMPNKLKKEFIINLLSMRNLKIEFDSKLDINDNGNKVYCSEYVWLAAIRTGVDDLGYPMNIAGKDYILIDSIYGSRWLQ